MDKETQEQVERLQHSEQQLQVMNNQKQQVQSQIHEIDSALEELKKTEHAYKIVGGIMVEGTSKDLTQELSSKKDVLSLRMKTFEQQEEKLKENVKRLQQDVMKKLKK